MSKVKAERNKRKDAAKELRAKIKALKDELKEKGAKEPKLAARLEGDIERANKELEKVSAKVRLGWRVYNWSSAPLTSTTALCPLLTG